MVLIATLKDENYLGWDRTVRLNIKGIGRQADDICRREMETAARWKGVFPAYYFLSVGYFAKLWFKVTTYKRWGMFSFLNTKNKLHFIQIKTKRKVFNTNKLVLQKYTERVLFVLCTLIYEV